MIDPMDRMYGLLDAKTAEWRHELEHRKKAEAEVARLNNLLDHAVEAMNSGTVASGFLLGERDQLRAEVERLRELAVVAFGQGQISGLQAPTQQIKELEAANKRLLNAAMGLQDDVEALQQQRAELVLTIARLRAGVQPLPGFEA